MSSTPLTPAKRLGLTPRPRPSLQTLQVHSRDTASPAPGLSPSTSRDMLARKTSYNQLTQNSLAAIPDASAGYGLRQASRAQQGATGSGEVEVGDLVNTPGGMYGVVKFIGGVKGKNGVFCGVELVGELAGKGKNDGAVDGVQYFTTEQPMSGIFVPLNRASKRNSTDSHAPPTPTLNSPTGLSALHPPSLTPARQRSESPSNRMYGRTPGSKPSLQRPESPVRRANTPSAGRSGLLQPSTPRTASAAGGRYGALSPTPGARFAGARMRSESIASAANVEDTPPPPTPNGVPRISQTPRSPYGSGFKQQKQPSFAMRSGSSFGLRAGSSMANRVDDHPDADVMSPTESSSGQSGRNDAEIQALQKELADKERQLDDQAAALNEMEASLTELQSLVASAAAIQSPPDNYGDADSNQLRALLREKNEKIQHLTSEFDAHRQDFRSTIDTLELAGTETQRVYEKRIEDLEAEVQQLQERNEDVESVAQTLKQLEELVAELEEGLENARRGQADAESEVEFLRGEVERCREELRREKEKSAAAVANAAVGKMMGGGRSTEELEKELRAKDDEIRGLKAIIHSLSRDSVQAEDSSVNGELKRSASYLNGDKATQELIKERHNSERLQSAIRELEEQIINTKSPREEELEREIEELKEAKKAREASRASVSSDKTATPWAGRSGEKREWRSRSLQGRSASNSVSSLQPPNFESSSSTIQEEEPRPTSAIDAEHTPIDSDAESSAPWCEICETAGHDILTCTNMFGSGAGGPASAGPKGLSTASAAAAMEDHTSLRSHTTSPVIERVASHNSLKAAPSPPPTQAAAPPPDSAKPFGGMSNASSPIDKKKSIHLPAPPPMDSGLGPAAGKSSGKVEMNKWCALCERDGHDSVDCPLDADF